MTDTQNKPNIKIREPEQDQQDPFWAKTLKSCCESLAFHKQAKSIGEFKKELNQATCFKDKLAVVESFFTVEFVSLDQQAQTKRLTEQAKQSKGMTVLGFLVHLVEGCSMKLYSRSQQNTPASKSEFTRWIEQGNVQINGYCDKDPQEVLDYPIRSLVLFPGGKTQCTII